MSIEIEELVGKLKEENQIRQTLSRVRALIKEEGVRRYFFQAMKENVTPIITCLQNEDAKTRKNAALLLGDLSDVCTENDKICQALYQAYASEQQLFVKSSYLSAMKNYDYRLYAEALQNRKEELSSQTVEESDLKHVNEEIHMIDEMLIMLQGLKKHAFTGAHVMSDLVLLTNRKHVKLVEEQVVETLKEAGDSCGEEDVKAFSAGIMVHTEHVAELMQLRTYQEMLYQVKGMISLPMNPAQAADQIVKSKLFEFLKERHEVEEDAAFYFRIELKSAMDLGSKSTFVKKMSYEIEKLSGNQLVNNKSNYEFEIRLIETKTGKFNCLVKLYTQEDQRFAYRKRSVAASLKPENAALLVALSKDYMKEDAQVLDPFCGTGTLLIERQKVVKANTSYGIDIYEEAIEGARVNTEAAGQIVHYINKDYFEFEHEYLFDEIITDMPFETGHKAAEEIEEIYQKFFKKAHKDLNGDGRVILYTHNRDYVEKYAKTSGFIILKHEIILEKAGTDLYILEVQ